MTDPKLYDPTDDAPCARCGQPWNELARLREALVDLWSYMNPGDVPQTIIEKVRNALEKKP